MKKHNYIPSHKSDYETVKKLLNANQETIKELVPDLLIWLQDGNWPIASDIAKILKPLNGELLPHIRMVLNTNDGDWKYFMLNALVRDLDQEVQVKLKNDLLRIVEYPTNDEVNSEVTEVAQEILNKI